MAINILGLDINDYNTSAVLVRDGAIVAGAQEERFSREKRTRRFPVQAMQFCLDSGGLELSDLAAVAVSVNPAIYLENLQPVQSERARYRGELLYAPLNYLLGMTPGADALDTHVHVREKQLGDLHVHYVNHHDAHAATAFYPGPFEEAAVLSVDGFGEKETTVFYRARDTEIKRIHRVEFPHSIGCLYAAMTEFLGMQPFRHEWKLMAAAAHGDPSQYLQKMRSLIHAGESGEFELDLSYFNFHQFHRPGYCAPKMAALLGEPYAPGAEPDERFFNIAAATQCVTGEILFRLLHDLHDMVRCNNLCLSGGVAMNCVLNGRIAGETPFAKVFVPPMPDDSGTSVGAALHVYHNVFNGAARSQMIHNYIGPAFSDDEIETELRRNKLAYRREADPCKTAAQCIADKKLVAWFQGGMEFGDRALGNRSILADPRDPDIPALINARVKDRRPFQPFAPSVLGHKAKEYFMNAAASPFMDKAFLTWSGKASEIPAVLNADGSARVQTVTPEQNELFFKLIESFETITGVPMVLNTSFNLRGEPIVCTPRDALRTFFSSGLDVLFLGPFMIEKPESL